MNSYAIEVVEECYRTRVYVVRAANEAEARARAARGENDWFDAGTPAAEKVAMRIVGRTLHVVVPESSTDAA